MSPAAPRQPARSSADKLRYVADTPRHINAFLLQVSRFGGHLVEMEPGPWDIILAEPTLQAMLPLPFSMIYVALQWLLGFIFLR